MLVQKNDIGFITGIQQEEGLIDEDGSDDDDDDDDDEEEEEDLSSDNEACMSHHGSEVERFHIQKDEVRKS